MIRCGRHAALPAAQARASLVARHAAARGGGASYSSDVMGSSSSSNSSNSKARDTSSDSSADKASSAAAGGSQLSASQLQQQAAEMRALMAAFRQDAILSLEVGSTDTSIALSDSSSSSSSSMEEASTSGLSSSTEEASASGSDSTSNNSSSSSRKTVKVRRQKNSSGAESSDSTVSIVSKQAAKAAAAAAAGVPGRKRRLGRQMTLVQQEQEQQQEQQQQQQERQQLQQQQQEQQQRNGIPGVDAAAPVPSSSSAAAATGRRGRKGTNGLPAASPAAVAAEPTAATGSSLAAATAAAGPEQAADATAQDFGRTADEAAAAAAAHDSSDAAAAAAGAHAVGDSPSLSELVALPSSAEQLAFPGSPFELRGYQRQAIHDMLQAWQQQKISAQLVMLPTGAGKTVVFASLARYLAEQQQQAHSSSSGADGADGATLPPAAAAAVAPPGLRVLVLAHRHELLRQTEEKFRLVWPGVSVSWVKGVRKEYNGQVVVASVQTAVNCIQQLKACRFGLVVLDEAHHAAAASWKSVLEGLGFIERDEAAQQQQQQQQQDPDGVAEAAMEALLSNRGAEEDEEDETGDGSIDLDTSSKGSSSSGYLPVWDPNRLLVGFTATPYRTNMAESKELYEMLVLTFSRTISDMINERHLCKPASFRILTTTDLRGVGGSSSGDFVLTRLSNVVNHPSRNRLVLAAYLAKCTQLADGQQQQQDGGRDAAMNELLLQAGLISSSSGSLSEGSRGDDDDSEEDEQQQDDGDNDGPDLSGPGGLSAAGRTATRKAVGFAVDISHAEALNDMFAAAGVRSTLVHSEVSVDEARRRLQAFRHGELDVLWNVEQLTEGFDEPSISALLMARPTKSRGLYTQMLGRGLRPHPSKHDCLVLDFTDKAHKVTQVMDVRLLLPDCHTDLNPVPRPEIEDRTRKIDTDAVPGGAMDVLGEGSGIDPQRLAWLRVGPHWLVSVIGGGFVWLVNTAGMGPQQRSSLGLLGEQAVSGEQEQAASVAAGPDAEQQQQQQQQQGEPHGGLADDEEEEEGEDEYEDRFVVLYQENTRNPDPLSWQVVAPTASSTRGMSEQDAYGAALTFILHHMAHQALQATQDALRQQWRQKRQGRGGGRPFQPAAKASSLLQDAQWRRGPASERQIGFLRKLGAEVPAKALSKGEAADLITLALVAPATEQQLQALRAVCNEQQLADLPVPLLQQHAAALNTASGAAPSSTAAAASGSSGKRQQRQANGGEAEGSGSGRSGNNSSRAPRGDC